MLPVLQAAIQSLDALDKADVSEIRYHKISIELWLLDIKSWKYFYTFWFCPLPLPPFESALIVPCICLLQGVHSTSRTSDDRHVCSVLFTAGKDWLGNCKASSCWSTIPKETSRFWQKLCSRKGTNYMFMILFYFMHLAMNFSCKTWARNNDQTFVLSGIL